MDESLDQPLRLPPKPQGELTWIAGGGIDESSVKLRFWGDELVPDEISKLLGIQPSKAWKKGHVFRGKQYDIVRSTGLWLQSGRRCGEIELEDKISQLLEQLPQDLAVWQEVMSQCEGGELFCGLWLERWNGSVAFSPALMQQIADRGLMLDLDIYFVGDDEVEGE